MTPAATPRLKVLYIAGNGRSGSTLLDVILGQVAGFFPVGEVRNVWDYGLAENRVCGCGVPTRECDTWGEIFASEFAGDAAVDPHQVAGWRERFAQTKRLAPMMWQRSGYARHNNDYASYLSVIERLYGAIARVTDSSVIVDSSKWPTYAFLLDSIPTIDLYVLHLVRDPRACAFSWTRKKEAVPGEFIDRRGLIQSTGYWMVWNPAIRHFWARNPARYMYLSYEAFAQRPREWVRKIVDFVGEEDRELPFLDEHRVRVARTHAIEGNAARSLDGVVDIKLDSAWEKKMPWSSRSLVTAMTWPLLWRYGYWPGPPRGADG